MRAIALLTAAIGSTARLRPPPNFFLSTNRLEPLTPSNPKESIMSLSQRLKKPCASRRKRWRTTRSPRM
jgi:hypothetical protein